MSQSITYFAPQSPYAYLGHERLLRLAACDIADATTLARLADDVGLDGRLLDIAAGGTETWQDYQANTRDTLDSGVFGSPRYVLGGQAFWGQDRLDFLERQLRAEAGVAALRAPASDARS